MKTATPSQLLLILATMLAAILPRPALADPVAEFDKEQAAEKPREEAALQRFPLLDKSHRSLPASDLYSLRVEHGMLVLRTALPATLTGESRSVKTNDQADWSMVVVQGGVAGKGPPVVPVFFSISRMTFQPQRTEAYCLLQVGSCVDISVSEHTPTGTRVISFREQFPNPAKLFPGGCQLAIMDASHPDTPTTWTSTNFTALTTDHPMEVDRYLRPLMRQIDEETVLAPDPMLAFEMFSDQWFPNPGVADKANMLVAAMAGGDFRSRVKAQNALAALGKDAALVLIRLDRSKFAPEQNARIDALLAPYHPVPTSEAAKLRTNPGFLANCLYSDDLTIRKSALVQLLSVTKLPLTFDPAAAAAERTKEISAILKQLTAKPSAWNKP